MRRLFFVVFVIAVLFLVGCSNQQDVSDTDKEVIMDEGKETQKQELSTKEKEELVEEKGIITDKLKFGDDKTSGEIIKNKITKTAEVKMSMSLNDSEEYTEFFGEQLSMAPFTINMACGLFAVAFFNQSALAELQEGGNLTIEAEEENPLDGYKVTKSYLEFIDFEEKTKIADCTATGPSWDNIRFNAYRKYESSFFGMQIGELPEEEGE